MVRKWSYLSNAALSISKDTLTNSVNLYHFKVFRKTTRFKKFNRGITKMVRKNYARRKHRTNWFIMSYITKTWVLNYLKMRQFERFFNSVTRFHVSAFTSDISIFLLKLSEVSNKLGINVISCSSAQLRRYASFSTKNALLSNPTHNTLNTIVQSTSLDNINSSSEVFTNLITFEGNSFFLEKPLTEIQHLINFTPLAQTSISLTSAIRTTLTLLTLYNIKRG